ncbi:hypothetical protein ElyMa_005810200 [Elysia marginata]|uniref:Uncharacterized protein n=1 Tax=Elysia marginata TaxID=1093978 RepID=A0AAV4FUE2_9GAST|nr:hypothetical protein ElyMa_005810200 [Elysia marginata]
MHLISMRKILKLKPATSSILHYIEARSVFTVSSPASPPAVHSTCPLRCSYII